ncbi:class I adenylate-forming enzyme family protein [Thermodesulfobacteriota bacterium]
MQRGVNWGMMLERQSKKRRNKLALIVDNLKFTYGELNSLANQMANYLAKSGVKKGDRVAIYLPNCWEHIVCHFGILKIGAIVVPLNVMYKAREIQYILDDSEAEAIITNAELHTNVKEAKRPERLKHVIVIDSENNGQPACDIFREHDKLQPAVLLDETEDLALIQYTSGTTGKPKGAMLTYHNIFSNVRATVNLFDFDENDTQLITLPLFHSFGTFSVYYSVFTGGTIVLVKRFDPERVLFLIDKYNVSIFCNVPPMLLSLLTVENPERFDLSTLRHCLCGAAVLPVEVLERVKRILGVNVVDGYGCTESYGMIVPPEVGVYRYGSIGVPLPVQEVRLVDGHDRDVPIGEVGEIISRGPLLMKGYWRKPEETAEAVRNGWFHTGDLARKDEDGFYYIVGRKKDMIISSGFNIYPREIEELLYQHPKIADAAVIGIPHEYKGEAVKACVVLKEGITATYEEIIDYCRDKLAVFKAPSIVEFRDDLPRNPSGKVLKRILLDESKQK